MHTIDETTVYYYTGPERRHASNPRRHSSDRRYRLRNESLISDFRCDATRRAEDEEGFVEMSGLDNGDNKSKPQPKTGM